jgi:hypothetical protein
MSQPLLHPDVEPLSFLLGTWRGEGRGIYPTIDDFTYTEEITFGHVGKPFIAYGQKTKGADGNPLHTEFGYYRPVGPEAAELILAQPSGITEIHTGRIEGTSLRFTTETVGLSPTAKDVRSVGRSLTVDGDTLTYRLDMAAVGQEYQLHLTATLQRVT